MLDFQLKSNWLETDFQEKFLDYFQKNEKQSSKNYNLFNSPFKCAVMKDFCTQETVSSVAEALLEVDLFEKHNDLYKFKQSDDLKVMSCPVFTRVREFFLKRVYSWLVKCTGLPLEANTIDITVSRYAHTDMLLCHDDRLEGRRVAFVWYFVPEDWTDADGGHLDMIDSDQDLQPTHIIHSIPPMRNSFLFFEVTSKSFHQVREVLSANKIRWSINGWFHGPPAFKSLESSSGLPPLVLKSPNFIEEEMLHKWISGSVLSEKNVAAMQQQFISNNDVLQLTNFLNEDVYAELLSCLSASTQVWQLQGPMNAQQVEIMDVPQEESILQDFFAVFQSKALMVLLTTITGLPLVCSIDSDIEDDAGQAKRPKLEENEGEEEEEEEFHYGQISQPGIRRWRHGLYTCIRDCDQDSSSAGQVCLQLVYHLGWPQNWSPETHGGAIVAFEEDADETRFLLTPGPNTLSLYLKDEKCRDFVSYLNHHCAAQKAPFYDCIVCCCPLLDDDEEEDDDAHSALTEDSNEN